MQASGKVCVDFANNIAGMITLGVGSDVEWYFYTPTAFTS